MADHIDLAPTPESAAIARRWSASVLDGTGHGHLADTVSLLVNELVANVVLHARTPFAVAIDGADDRIRVEVRDGSDSMPARPQHSERLSSTGRGLLLLDELATAHGAERLPEGGKLVWFEVGAARSGTT